MTRHHFPLIAVLFAAALALAADSSQKTILADFESNFADDVIAPGASSSSRPWRRYGEATADNIVATQSTGEVLSGKMSAMYPVFWPNKFGAASMVTESPMDLTGNSAGLITIKSSKADTKTQVLFSISDGKTTYLSKTPQAMSGEAQTLKFPLSAMEMERVDGPPAELPAVLAAAQFIGFKVTSDGSKYSEKIFFDDLAVTK